MATILKSGNREFEENPGRIDNFRLLSDISRIKSGINPQNLNFDLRLLNPGQFSSPYHFHRNAGALTLAHGDDGRHARRIVHPLKTEKS